MSEFGEHLVPVGSARVGPGLEAGDEVALLPLVEDVQSQLQRHGFHVSALQGGGDVPATVQYNRERTRIVQYVHMHLQESAHRSPILFLLDLQLREKVDKPLEALLVAIDPEEVNLLQFKHARLHVVGPAVGTVGTRLQI